MALFLGGGGLGGVPLDRHETRIVQNPAFPKSRSPIATTTSMRPPTRKGMLHCWQHKVWVKGKRWENPSNGGHPKNQPIVPLYWLINRDPYNGLL